MLGGDFTKYPLTMKVLGLDDMIDDERFKPGPEREKHLDEMYDRMEEAFLKKTAAEWDELFLPLDITSLELRTSLSVSTDEQAWANEFLTRMECPDGTEWVMPNSPITFHGVEKTHTKHAGPRGSNNVEVLKQYGYSDEEIKGLYDRGVVSEAQ
jgi:crotonobetainyl-CoA:carnitine CoA-transferase CaiB-like acyl-CoA transferase